MDVVVWEVASGYRLVAIDQREILHVLLLFFESPQSVTWA